MPQLASLSGLSARALHPCSAALHQPESCHGNAQTGHAIQRQCLGKDNPGKDHRYRRHEILQGGHARRLACTDQMEHQTKGQHRYNDNKPDHRENQITIPCGGEFLELQRQWHQQPDRQCSVPEQGCKDRHIARRVGCAPPFPDGDKGQAGAGQQWQQIDT